MIKTSDDLQDLRRRIYCAAKAEPDKRFWGLFLHVTKIDTLKEAYRLAKANDGAPGADGVTFDQIETLNLDDYLFSIRNDLQAGTYRPMRSRKVEIPKGNGKTRTLSIPMNSERPVQLILAGKAHPADHPGQALIQQWIKFIQETEARKHVIFLSDDDMYLTQKLVAGVDVWINTPRRPWEACGTSGMKVLVNGGINLSELDGWWAEAYAPELGWAIGDGREHGDDPGWDAFEADELYSLLEKEVVPQFYERDAEGIPRQWVAKIRASMAHLTPEFSSNRAVREYTEKHYLSAASTYRKRSCDRGAQAKAIIDWQHALETTWSSMHFGNCGVESTSSQHIFTTELFLGNVDCKDVNVQLFANGAESGAIECLEMERTVVPLNNSLPSIYKSTVLSKRSPSDYTARVIPRHEEAFVPFESNQILWQK